MAPKRRGGRRSRRVEPSDSDDDDESNSDVDMADEVPETEPQSDSDDEEEVGFSGVFFLFSVDRPSYSACYIDSSFAQVLYHLLSGGWGGGGGSDTLGIHKLAYFYISPYHFERSPCFIRPAGPPSMHTLAKSGARLGHSRHVPKKDSISGPKTSKFPK